MTDVSFSQRTSRRIAPVGQQVRQLEMHRSVSADLPSSGIGYRHPVNQSPRRRRAEAAMLPGQQLRPPILPEHFYELNNSSGVMAWLQTATAIGMSIWIAITWPVLFPICALVIGARQRALATLLHEASHLTLAKNRDLNKAVGTLSGYLVFQIWSAYRESHVAGHHSKFGNAQDPDYKFHLDIGLYERFNLLQLLKGYMLYSKYLVAGRLIGSASNVQELVKMACLWVVMLYALGWQNVALYWLLPMLIGFGPIGFLIEIAEHWPLMRSVHPLYRTRNRASSIFELPLFGIHNERFHLVHHLYPRVPMHSLALVDAHLANVWPEYKLWNASNGGIFLSSNDAPPLVSVLVRSMTRGA